MKTSALLALVFGAALIRAADYPAPVEGDWVVRDFRFHTGETFPDLRLHYITVGARTRRAGSDSAWHQWHRRAHSCARISPANCFGPGQPLDAATHFIILPDAIGAGKSSKPSDGMRTRFPRYNYDDMVQAQYRLVKEHLGVGHLRLVLGTSMGGMLVWVWGEKYPDFMDALLPTAAQPTAMSGRNWMLRRMVVDLIRNDPEWNGGNYTQQPRSLKLAQVYFGVATSGGTQAIYRAAPTREKADQILDQRLAQDSNADANDVIYQMDASRDYDPAPQLEKIQARVLAMNSADDERNPAGTRHHGAGNQTPKAGPLCADSYRSRDARPRDHGHGQIVETVSGGVSAAAGAGVEIT